MPYTTPRVSIGLPVYNGEKYLTQTLDSILAQSFRDFELIIADNASTDRTGDICEDYAARDPRISYHRNDINIGLVGNFNRVVQLARAPLFKWASGNDLCDPGMIEKCVDALKQDQSVVLAFPLTRLIDSESKTITECPGGLNLMQTSAVERVKQLIENLTLNNIMNGVTRLDVLRKTRMIANYFASDINLLLELCLRGKFFEVPEYLFSRRMHPEYVTHSGDLKKLQRAYDPSTAYRHSRKRLRLNMEHFGTVWRADFLSVGERLSLFWLLSRKLFWERRLLWGEIVSSRVDSHAPGSTTNNHSQPSHAKSDTDL